jgi:hypothetical protein
VVGVGSALLLPAGLVLAVAALPVGESRAAAASPAATAAASPAPGPSVVSTGSSKLFTASAVPCTAATGSSTCTTEPTSL